MKLRIEINMDNAAFDESPEIEVSAILKQYAERIEMNGMHNRTLLDINGNSVGFAVVDGE